jgi:branched-chain amino acid transport system substrate-binding protein
VVIVIVIVAAGAAYAFLYAQGYASQSTSTSATQAKPISIVFGATLSMTGPLQAFGQEQNWTLSFAIDNINKFGGIPLANGSHALVKLVVLDDKTDPSVAQSNLQTLVSQYNAAVILGELGGVQDSVAQQFASRNQIPYIGPVYTSTAKTCSDCSNYWVFSPFHNETNEAHIFLNWFHTVDPSTPAHNVTIAFFGEGDPAAQSNNLAGEAFARSLGYTVCSCSDLTFTPVSTSEMSSFISSAKSAGAEAIYGLPLPPDAALMVQTAHQLNYVPKAWLLTRGTAVAPFAIPALGGAGNLTVGVMSAFPWQPAVPYAGNMLGHTINNSQIVSEYEAVWKHPPTLEGVYFTEVLVAADAIAKAGTLDKAAIRQALRTTTFQTPMGDVSFTPGGQWAQSGKFMLMMQWQNAVVGGSTIQALQILQPTKVTTTNYIIYPFSWTNQTHQTWPP